MLGTTIFEGGRIISCSAHILIGAHGSCNETVINISASSHSTSMQANDHYKNKAADDYNNQHVISNNSNTKTNILPMYGTIHCPNKFITGWKAKKKVHSTITTTGEKELHHKKLSKKIIVMDVSQSFNKKAKSTVNPTETFAKKNINDKRNNHCHLYNHKNIRDTVEEMFEGNQDVSPFDDDTPIVILFMAHERKELNKNTTNSIQHLELKLKFI